MKLHPLDRKLLRDLWRLRGQVLAIGLVIASGVGLLVMSLTSLEALRNTSAAYYERYRFADVFAQVKRAPESLAARIAAIDGVQSVETRVVHGAVLDVAGFDEPVMGQLVSVPGERRTPAQPAGAARRALPAMRRSRTKSCCRNRSRSRTSSARAITCAPS